MDTNILKRPDKNKDKKIENNVRCNGDNLSETREFQQQKYGNAIQIANNRNQCQNQNQKSSTSARNNDGPKEVTKMATDQHNNTQQ